MTEEARCLRIFDAEIHPRMLWDELPTGFLCLPVSVVQSVRKVPCR